MTLRNLLLLSAAFIALAVLTTSCGHPKTAQDDNTFHLENPDTVLSPYTGMTRAHWVQAATYLLDGAYALPSGEYLTYRDQQLLVVEEKE